MSRGSTERTMDMSSYSVIFIRLLLGVLLASGIVQNGADASPSRTRNINHQKMSLTTPRPPRKEKYYNRENTRQSRGRNRGSHNYNRYNSPGMSEQRLLAQLLDSYDNDARGVTNPNKTINVKIELLLLRIQSLDERSQVLTTTGLIICDWQDDRLRWNAADYEYVDDIVVHPDRIWLPELALMNGADELAPDFRNIRVLVNNDGHVHWEPGGIFTTTCDIDIRYFPFDEQSCPIMFGAWAYYTGRMNISNASDVVVTHDFRLNGEWEVTETKAEWRENILPCCPDTRYPYVIFTLFLRRRYTFYVMNIILPCSLLSILVMIVFCLPPDAGEKISLGISVLLAFTVFLLMVAENVPRTSLHIPVMVIYLTFTMALGTVSVCMTVLVLNLHHRDAERSVPRWARVLVLGYLRKVLCVGARKPKTMQGNMRLERPDKDTTLRSGLKKMAKEVGLLKPMLASNGELDARFANSCIGHHEQVFPSSREQAKQDITHEWKEVAHVLDRLFFWIVFFFMSSSALIIMMVPLYKDEFSGAT